MHKCNMLVSFRCPKAREIRPIPKSFTTALYSDLPQIGYHWFAYTPAEHLHALFDFSSLAKDFMYAL